LFEVVGVGLYFGYFGVGVDYEFVLVVVVGDYLVDVVLCGYFDVDWLVAYFEVFGVDVRDVEQFADQLGYLVGVVFDCFEYEVFLVVGELFLVLQ